MTKLFFFPFVIIASFFFRIQDDVEYAKKKAQFYSKKSEVFYKKGDNEKHKLYTDSLLDISRRYKFRNMELNAMMNQGVYYRNTNQFKKALALYLQVLEKAKTIPDSDKNQIMTMVNMGNIYNTIEKPDKAIIIFQKALPLIKKHPNNNYITAATYAGLGKANAISGNNDLALQYQYKLKHLADSINNTYLQVSALTDISTLFNDKNDFSKGLDFAKKALELNKTSRDSILQKDVILLNLGISFNGLEEIDSSKSYLIKAKKVAIKKNNKNIEKEAEKYLAQIYEQLNNYEEAQKSQKRYSELTKTNINELKEATILDVENVAEQKLKVAHDKNRKNVFLLIASILLFVVILLISIVFNRKRKKHIIKKNVQLQKDYKGLQNEYASLKDNLKQLSVLKNDKKHDTKKYKNSSLDQHKREAYMNQILEFMEENKPYLDSDLTQSSFAKKINIPSYHLSEVLSLSFEQNFYNFINFYRVDTAQNLLMNHEYNNLTIEAIAYDSGFNSKTSFNRVFKSITGQTPSAFKKAHQSN